MHIAFTVIFSALILSIGALTFAAAQTNWFDGSGPSCDWGKDWLVDHNFASCYRTTIIEEQCLVATMECSVIPRGL